jgi:hypothetical protein
VIGVSSKDEVMVLALEKDSIVLTGEYPLPYFSKLPRGKLGFICNLLYFLMSWGLWMFPRCKGMKRLVRENR